MGYVILILWAVFATMAVFIENDMRTEFSDLLNTASFELLDAKELCESELPRSQSCEIQWQAVVVESD